MLLDEVSSRQYTILYRQLGRLTGRQVGKQGVSQAGRQERTYRP